MGTKKLHASSAAAGSVPSPASDTFDPREASALYLMAKLVHVPPGADTRLRRRLEDNRAALEGALSHPFAREVARALRGEVSEVGPKARRYAEALVQRAAPSDLMD